MPASNHTCTPYSPPILSEGLQGVSMGFMEPGHSRWFLGGFREQPYHSSKKHPRILANTCQQVDIEPLGLEFGV